ncbi:MAG: fatty acid hydroxylase [Bacteroidetes bacterium]|nr:MAG: fatty acid hydroxylase [Bacteroidota bacterium]
MAKANKTEKATVFQNPFLEALIKSSPGMTAFTYLSIIGIEFLINWYYGFVTSWQTGVVLYLSGLFFWTFAEYMLHRYVFHWIEDSPIQQKFHYMVHGFHHKFPIDEDHLFMPPVPGYFLGALFTGIFYIFMREWAFVFGAGFITGYMIYAAIHYSTHKFKPPKMLKGLWRHHNMHHFRYPDKAFGVSSPLWDIIFGTMPPKPERRKKQEAVETASS